jgi:polar amino acid transport system substrate-binding protein
MLHYFESKSMSRHLYLTVSSLLALLLSFAARADFAPIVLTVYCEQNPPFSFRTEGETRGIYVKIVRQTLERMSRKSEVGEFVVAPWARGFAETQRNNNTLLFSVVRSPDREDLFQWAGPIGPFQPVIMARKDSNLDFSNTAKRNSFSYVVTKYSVSENLLTAAGVTPRQIARANSTGSAAGMLARGRVDGWVRDKTVALSALKEYARSDLQFKIAHAFDITYRYVAFSKNTDADFVQEFDRALTLVLKEQGLSYPQ